MTATTHGTNAAADLKAAICEETSRLCLALGPAPLISIVLTGSLARDEATFVRRGNTWTLLGDAEFLVVIPAHARLPLWSDLAFISATVERHLLETGLVCRVTLSAVHTTYLHQLPPHIFAYELRACGQVVWGQPWILNLIPTFSPGEIPREDAWHLLCNRIVEQLDVADDPEEPGEVPSRHAHYRTIKLYLDMATSLLVFADSYAPTYRARQERLDALARGSEHTDHWPFPLQDFARVVRDCTAWKLLPVEEHTDARRDLSATARQYAHLLWRWELARLAGVQLTLSDRALFHTWKRLQPLHLRLRGWVHVLRAQGWYRSWKDWKRWARLMWRASPRYWIYAAATELFFHDTQARVGLELGELRGYLPHIPNVTPPTGPEWRRVASEIVWNYRRFLVNTRT